MNLPEEILNLKDSLKSLPEPKRESARKKARREALELWKSAHGAKKVILPIPIMLRAITPLVPGPLRNASTYEIIGGRSGATEMWVAHPEVQQKTASKTVLPKPKARHWCK